MPLSIGIDPNTGTQDGERFYSASYLRLREGWKLGTFATAPDKDFTHGKHGNDLISALLNGDGGEIIIGGQQRVCSARREGKVGKRLPLPLGKSGDFPALNCKHLVKLVLLSPAIWPEIPAGVSKRGTATKFHPGGWLPNWLSPASGQLLLQSVSSQERIRRRALNYDGEGYRSDENATGISARLVAAIVPKPIVVSGWALPNETGRPIGGAKSTQLAVPAGAVYYFETETQQDAIALASNSNQKNFFLQNSNPA